MKKLRDYYNRKLIDRFGSRRGVVLTYWHSLKQVFGAYNNYRKIDWNNIDRLVFVCKGNICRSAYAELIAKSLGIEAISFGISTGNDYPANSEALKIARKRGMDLSRHKTTSVQSVILRNTDLLVAMEPWQADSLTAIFNNKHNVTLLGLWFSPLRPHVHDPYGLAASYFDNCFDYIEKSVNEIAKKIKKN